MVDVAEDRDHRRALLKVFVFLVEDHVSGEVFGGGFGRARRLIAEVGYDKGGRVVVDDLGEIGHHAVADELLYHVDFGQVEAINEVLHEDLLHPASAAPASMARSSNVPSPLLR